MIIETASVSRWYVFRKGFHTCALCEVCRGKNIVYKKAHLSGFIGIAPHCMDCGKASPLHFKLARKSKIKTLTNFLRQTPILLSRVR